MMYEFFFTGKTSPYLRVRSFKEQEKCGNLNDKQIETDRNSTFRNFFLNLIYKYHFLVLNNVIFFKLKLLCIYVILFIVNFIQGQYMHFFFIVCPYFFNQAQYTLIFFIVCRSRKLKTVKFACKLNANRYESKGIS